MKMLNFTGSAEMPFWNENGSEKFRTELAHLLEEEGGISDRNRSADPGGLTNHGVTQFTLERYIASRKRKNDPRIVTFPSNVRQLTKEHALLIYKHEFWDVASCEQLPDWAAVLVFDTAVHSGPSAAVRFLQRALGRVAVDGIAGPQTINRALTTKTPLETISSYTKLREAYLRSLPNESKNPGWFPRVKRVERRAKRKVH